ncbi:MAG: hypothetical protein KBG39_07760 [Opitutaceae bacterium]|nr:hypothetical protein [Opitutaceae bacterium]
MSTVRTPDCTVPNAHAPTSAIVTNGRKVGKWIFPLGLYEASSMVWLEQFK